LVQEKAVGLRPNGRPDPGLSTALEDWTVTALEK
jgi:hypothetical protein